MSKPIVVIGSINMDLVGRTRRLPGSGETVLGETFETIPGGKGANQAVAAARLAKRDTLVHMIGRIGDDDFGRRLLNGLRQNRVRTDHVKVTRKTPSGVAMITVDAKGENSIVVAAGANASLTSADIDAAKTLVASAACVVMQLEIPLNTVRHAIQLCRRLGVFTILDPAPVPERRLSRSMLVVDCFTPNEHEVARILRLDCHNPAAMMCQELIGMGARSVALKLGKRGSFFADRAGVNHAAKPFRVKAIDTTAAGDAFTGALAVAHAENIPPPQAMRFANAAGALCCQKFGAQPALPSRADVDRLMHGSQR